MKNKSTHFFNLITSQTACNRFSFRKWLFGHTAISPFRRNVTCKFCLKALAKQ